MSDIDEGLPGVSNLTATGALIAERNKAPYIPMLLPDMGHVQLYDSRIHKLVFLNETENGVDLGLSEYHADPAIKTVFLRVDKLTHRITDMWARDHSQAAKVCAEVSPECTQFIRLVLVEPKGSADAT